MHTKDEQRAHDGSRTIQYDKVIHGSPRRSDRRDRVERGRRCRGCSRQVPPTLRRRVPKLYRSKSDLAAARSRSVNANSRPANEPADDRPRDYSSRTIAAAAAAPIAPTSTAAVQPAINKLD